MALHEEKHDIEEHERTSVDGPIKADDFGLAKQAAEDEHNISFREALRMHPRAVMWSVLLSTCIV